MVSLGNFTALRQPEAFEQFWNAYFSSLPTGKGYQYSPDKDELYGRLCACIFRTEQGISQFVLHILHSELEDEEWNIAICKNSLLPFIRFDLNKHTNRHRMDSPERDALYDSLEKMVGNGVFSMMQYRFAKGQFYGEVFNVLCGCLAAYVPRMPAIEPVRFAEVFESFLHTENGYLLVKHFGEGVRLKGNKHRCSGAHYVFFLEDLQEKINEAPLTQDSLYEISGIGWADLFHQYAIHEEPLVPGAW